MVTLIIMLLLIVVAGWFDSRLNWPAAEYREQEVKRV